MSRFAGLPAALKATTAAAKDQPEEIDDTDGDGEQPPAKSKKKEPVMADENQSAALDAAKKEGHDAGFKAATDRFSAVMASEHYAGREASAGKLLTKASLFSASADDITDLLADMPKVERAALTEEQQREAAEEGGRKEMQAVLAKVKNSNIDADAGKDGKAKAESSASVWDSAINAVCPDARK
jgi:hypothetical protein